MSHDIASDVNGNATLAYLDYETPWHGLGTPMSGDVAWTLEEFMNAAGVNFVTEKEALQTSIRGIAMPDDYAIVRTDTEQVLGRTGKRYECFQVERGLSIIAKYGPLDVVGMLNGGAVVFGTVKLEDVKVGSEEIKRNLLITMGNDGTVGVDLKNSDTRAVCRNTIDGAFAGSGRKWSAKHTQNIESRIATIEQELEALFDGSSAQALSDEIEKMLNTTITDYQVEKVLDQTFPKGNKALSTDAWTVRGLYEQHDTVRNANGEDLKGTQWGLYQATSFFDLWSKDVRGDRLEKQAFATMDDNPTPNARKVASLMRAGVV